MIVAHDPNYIVFRYIFPGDVAICTTGGSVGIGLRSLLSRSSSVLAMVRRNERLESLNERPADALQLQSMRHGQLANQTATPGSQTQENLTLVPRVPGASDETALHEPIDQLHRAVVADLQAVRQRSHSRQVAGGHPDERQERLVLLWLDSHPARGLLAEAHKTPDLESNLRKRAILGLVQILVIHPRSLSHALLPPEVGARGSARHVVGGVEVTCYSRLMREELGREGHNADS